MLNIFKKKQTEEYESNYRKTGDSTLLIVIGCVVVCIIIGFVAFNASISTACRNYEKTSQDLGFEFALNNGLLPSYEGTSITINLDAVPNWNKEFRGSSCTGTLTIYKSSSGYVKVINLKNCKNCTTANKNLSEPTEKYDENKTITNVSITYNYQTRALNYSEWTDWYESSLISPTASANNIKLPYDEKNLPEIPESAEVISYEVETKTFYSYRDQSWAFYKIANNSYSDFSSTKPANYAYKDSKTEIKTEWSDWSTSYPTEYEYRDVEKKVGYRFYYMDNGIKIYYNNGEYSVGIEDETLKNLYKSKDEETVDMSRYRDTMWRWYNGENRNYSSYMNKATTSYPYKDEGLTKYSNWSAWKETSSLSSENASYREEKIDVRSRYKTKYAINSLDKLNEYLSLKDFETATKRTLSDMQADENIKVSIKYTYTYSK